MRTWFHVCFGTSITGALTGLEKLWLCSTCRAHFAFGKIMKNSWTNPTSFIYWLVYIGMTSRVTTERAVEHFRAFISDRHDLAPIYTILRNALPLSDVSLEKMSQFVCNFWTLPTLIWKYSFFADMNFYLYTILTHKVHDPFVPFHWEFFFDCFR